MLDNRKYKLRKLADRGWEDLRRQLDRELPATTGEQRPRRLAMWWPAAATLLLGLAAGAMLDEYFGSPGATRPETTISQPSARVGETAATAPGLPGAGEQEVRPSAIPAEQITAGAVPANPSPGLRMPESQVQKPLNFKKERNSFLLGSQPDNALPVQAAETALESPRSESGLSPLNPAEAADPVPSLSVGVEVLPSLVTQLPARSLSSMQLPVLAVSQQLPAVVSPSGWELYFSGLMPDYFGAGGVSLGILNSRPMKRFNFSQEFGLGYTYLIQPMTVTFTQEEFTINGSNQTAGADEFTVLNTSLGNRKVAEAANNSARFLKPLHLHYLELPFSLSMRANSRLRLRLGLLASLMLSSKSDYTSGGLFGNNPGATQLQEDAMSASINYVGMSPVRELKVFDLSAMAGLDIQLSPKWSLGLSSQYGMFDMIPDNGRGDFNRLLRFTFRRSV
ncbi:MAG: hypothetical protein RI973_1939 [Bacteroidota bacterium]|jgi:hypothetical protein